MDLVKVQDLRSFINPQETSLFSVLNSPLKAAPAASQPGTPLEPPTYPSERV